MNCCENCFNDRYMVHIIKAFDEQGNCDYCNSENANIVQINDIGPYFEGFLSYYEKLEHSVNYIYGEQEAHDIGERLYDLVQSNWYIFSEDIEGPEAEGLFYDIIKSIKPEFDVDELFVEAFKAFTYESTVDIWNDFSYELKHGNRFFPSKGYIVENLVDIIKQNEHQIFQNALCYRGRLGVQPIDKMGAPPKEFATAGRANPKGISYLYAAPQKNTCIAELRPYKGAEITLVEMTTVKSLTFVRLNTRIPLISPFQFKGGELKEQMETYYLFSKIVSDLSKPVSPDKSEIDYLPTQFLSELIKNQGYDGFLFKSALGPGDNYVIFDERNVNLQRIEVHAVRDITYQSNLIHY